MEAFRLLKSDDIDSKKWDACIDQAKNKSIYAKYYYVDTLSKRWYGLVIGDYVAVLPLPYKNYGFFKILYTPSFIQRLDLISSTDLDIEPYLLDIRKKIADIFRLVIFRSINRLWNTKSSSLVNFYLPLNKSYVELSSCYTKECAKNVRKALKRNISCCINSISIDKIIALYIDVYGKKSMISSSQYKKLKKVLSLSLQRNLGFTLHVESEQKECIYAAFFLLYSGRLSYILGAPTIEGRKRRATYFAIDYIIQHFAGQDYVLDFEGSSIPNVAHFYNGFGPVKEIYNSFIVNNLSFPLKQLMDLKLLNRH